MIMNDGQETHPKGNSLFTLMADLFHFKGKNDITTRDHSGEQLRIHTTEKRVQLAEW